MAYQSDCADVVCQIAGRINSSDNVWRIFTGEALETVFEPSPDLSALALARTCYETETLRDGWSGRHLDRQISSPFYELSAAVRLVVCGWSQVC